ncbi:tyrosine--tRNA ligase [Thermaerobacter composti]|uniref:Tyrosine--tRNA ligase n=1 Tax=Thermaerobacter composti TaxID=554949 RepID=A0ABZ0QRD4_9FIRM|nr:tyrosine--tRNA ligase [Thermaerobacter composti]WPD19849.1 tyrosine--tRNA ligase [Thermaerobacter composti]
MARRAETALSPREQLEVLRRGAAEIVTEDELLRKLERSVRTGRPLRVKLGLDPTAPDLHLGHTVVLRKLRQFQDLGHQVVLIIGDFTGRIGDPTGKSVTRPQLTEEQVRENARTYAEQLGRILDMERTELTFNDRWLGAMTFADVVRLAAKYTVARMLERDDFAQRYREGRPIAIHEFLYPLAQAYDSVAVRADVELGGTDQKFNLLVGREIQREYGQEPQVALLMPLLEGTDGRDKMSKSLGNYIGIAEPPGEMFGKTMSIPDPLIVKYMVLATDLDMDEIRRLERGMAEGTVNPRDAKLRLAHALVRMYHGKAAADAAQEEFLRVFSRHELPAAMPEVTLPAPRLDAVRLLRVAGMAPSNSEARRLIEQGAVRLDGRRITDPHAALAPADGAVLQVGKRRFARLRLPGGA